MYTMFNSNVIKGLIPPVAFFGVLAAAYISLDMLLVSVCPAYPGLHLPIPTLAGFSALL